MFETRWVDLETIALYTFAHDWKAIVTDLRRTISSAASFAAETLAIARCRVWLRQLVEFKFVEFVELHACG